MAGKSKNSIPGAGQESAARAESDDRHRDEVRADKRAQFESSGRNRRLGLIAGAVVLVALAMVAAAVAMSGGDEASPPPQAPVAAGSESIDIPVAEVSDGKAHFYSYDAGGTAVNYFVVKSPDGELRAALDACDVCYPQKKGYRQEGDVMVCNNCGRRFPTAEINVQEGGCNPSPLERSVEGDQLVISVADLEAGATYFQ